MSDPKTPPDNGGDDSITNLKAEMNRKLGNVEESFKKANTDLLAQIQSMLKPAAPKVEPAPKKDLAALLYADPEAALAAVKEEAKREFREETNQLRQQDVKRTSTLAALTRDFPELADQDSDLYKAAVDKYNVYAAEHGDSPAAYRAAVAEAALEKGLLPKSKRKVAESDDDSFALAGGNSANRPAAKKKGEIDPSTEALARMFPQYIDMDDPKVRERIANKHGRKSYKSWE